MFCSIFSKFGASSKPGAIHTGRKLTSGEVDLALGLVPELDTGFYQQTLNEDDWVCICRADHPHASQIVSIADYEQEVHIAVATRSGALLHSAIERQRIRRNVQLELPGFLGLPAILTTTHFVATLPRGIGEALARTAGLAVFQSPVPAPTFKIKQYWHTRYQNDSANRWLRSVCANLFIRHGVANAELLISN
jgi:DNA-binding transcriptional LysR family regulator